MRYQVSLVGLLLFVAACGDCNEEPPLYQPVNTRIFGEYLGAPALGSSPQQRQDFARGRDVALRRFTTTDGLGPSFNASFCGACHERPAIGGGSPRYRDFLLVGATLEDGSYVSLGKNGVQTQFNINPPYYSATSGDVNHVVNRNAIPFFGVGALAALDEASILANVDENDEDNDGISGRPNYDRGFVGRFGSKAQTVSIEGFIRGPLFNHLGITSNPLSEANKARLPVPSQSALSLNELPLFCIACQAAAPDEPTIDDDDAPDPELSEDDLFALVSFAMLMGAPAPSVKLPSAANGELVFEKVNCVGCHIPALEGPGGLVPAYTDLLLHDMGDELADGVVMGVATGNEFRTSPLWGITAVGPYLHDGRADTLDMAIRMHGGESQQSKDDYEALSPKERGELLEFLESLGGAAQASAGQIPPRENAPLAGKWGGPVRPLTSFDRNRFEQGRREFDRDMSKQDGLGLGVNFNGDSCRACHFEPEVGGAGPVGVNVTRQGIIDEETGEFFAPAQGTMAHRFATTGQRPAVDPDSNVFELRQTPAIFGLGLVETISSAAIVAQEDPNDEDGDGISGKAHRLADGRIGRFGWKAGIPTLEDFVRDATSNEVGLTLEDSPRFVAGIATDTDDVPDPEFTGSSYKNLVFFNEKLGPPPSAVHRETAGSRLFQDVGCADCHTPSLPGTGGKAVKLYSDLLLHDVAPEGYRGVADGQASMREFRTPPLWGIGRTGPYMHDGLSPTLEAAILAHAAEGEASKLKYEELRKVDKEELIRFLESI